MDNLAKNLIVALSIVPCVGFAQKTVEIDVKKNVHEISKYIYGTNEPYDGATATRWGGNRSSSYNWENNASNGGNDYEFISDNFYDYSGTATPALPILNATKTADRKGQYNLVSLQAVGYVAADKSGAVSEDEIAPSPRWKAISYHKDTEKSPYTLTPDVDDDTVYIDELINYLSVKLGRAGDGGVSAFAIDNEPYLWNSTHARMHPEKTTPDELFKKTVDLATVIRELAPGADIYGPMFFGYTDAYHWGEMNVSKEWMAIYNKSKDYPVPYYWFVDYYLDTLRKVEEASGIRPIDAIAFHWYPESYGKTTHKRIVNTGRDGVNEGELIAEDMIEARLQAPRGLWDPKYNYYGNDGRQSYVCVYDGKAILSKIKESIKNFYPGTKIAFTEFEYGAEDHWSGGLCLADVLGVFGREDVYLACKWNSFKKYSIAAYDLYLNYDGNGSQFGSTSVYAMQNDNASLSSFASLDEKGNLHIIAINKTNEIQNTIFNIDNGLYSDGVVYGFDKTSYKITQYGTVDNIQNSSFAYDLPAYSAVHFILNATPQTKLTNAVVTDENSDEIILTFDGSVEISSASDAKQEFTVSVDGVPSEISSVSCLSSNTIAVKLSKTLMESDNNVKISYLGTNVTGISNLPIASFDTMYVYNEMKNAPIYALSSSIDLTGSRIEVLFSKNLGDFESTGLILQQDEKDIAIAKYEISNESPRKLLIYPQERLFKYSTKTLSSVSNTDLKAVDGALLSDFEFALVGGANNTPKIDSMVVFDNYTINVYFDANMEPTIDYTNAGFSIIGNEGEIPFVAKYNNSSRYISFLTTVALQPNMDYTLNYEDKGLVRTIHYGMLESFSEKLDNQLKDMGAQLVTIPGVVQGEQFWTRLGEPVVETCSDESTLGTGYHLGYITAGDKYAYKIKVEESKNYTVYMRYASTTAGSIVIVIDGKEYPLSVPSTASYDTWKETYRVLPLEEGEHDVVIEIKEAGFNINYFRFEDEENYPSTKVTNAKIPIAGDMVRLYFPCDLEILPLAEEIEMTLNDTVDLKVSSVEWNTTSILNLLVDTTIYKGAKLSLKLNSSTMRTVDGGYVLEANLVAKNLSTQVYKEPTIDDVNDLDSDEFIIMPNPIFINQEFSVISSKETKTSYTIYSGNGGIYKQGQFVGKTSILIPQSGIYYGLFSDGNETIVKKIIVR